MWHTPLESSYRDGFNAQHIDKSMPIHQTSEISTRHAHEYAHVYTHVYTHMYTHVYTQACEGGAAMTAS